MECVLCYWPVHPSFRPVENEPKLKHAIVSCPGCGKRYSLTTTQESDKK